MNKVLSDLTLEGDSNVDKLKRDYDKQVKEFMLNIKNIENKQQEFQPRSGKSVTSGPASLKSNGQAQLQTQTQESDGDLLVANYSLREAEHREEQISEMVENLGELHEMYKDLNILVHDQQENIDSVEANVQETRNQVETGTENITEASEYQKSYRKKLCYALICVLIIIAIVLGFVLGLAPKK